MGQWNYVALYMSSIGLPSQKTWIYYSRKYRSSQNIVIWIILLLRCINKIKALVAGSGIWAHHSSNKIALGMK